MTTSPARRPGPDLSTVELDALLKRLHLANMRRVHAEAIARAETEQWSYRDFLALLIAEEVAHRTQTRLQRLTRRAHFPYLKTIEDFDFTLQSQLRLALLGSYLAPDFVTEGRSLILHGQTGRGKTHLSVAIAYRAIQHGFDALFTTAAQLIEDLSNAGRKGRLHEALGRYTHPHVLVIDEVGYLTYGPEAANVLYHVVNDRHLRTRPMVFTTNKPMHDWGRVLHDPDLASAILDRVLERGRWITLDGPSGRTKHLKLHPAIPQDGPGARVSGQLVPEFPEPTDGKEPPAPDVNPARITSGGLHRWHGRFRVSVSMDHSAQEVQALRQRRTRLHGSLSRWFEECRQRSDKTFEHALKIEQDGYRDVLLETYRHREKRQTELLRQVEAATGEPYPFELESPVSLLGGPGNDLLYVILETLKRRGVAQSALGERIGDFLNSEHFRSMPIVRTSTRLFALIAHAAANHQKAPPDEGTASDIDLVSAYLPYCDAMMIDKRTRLMLEQGKYAKSYPCRLFSRNTGEKFLGYLRTIEEEADPLVLSLVRSIYGEDQLKPYVSMFEN